MPRATENIFDDLKSATNKSLLTSYNDPISKDILYSNLPDDRFLCAGNVYGHIDACQGDSGGPLICVENSKPVIHGIVSWGIECGKPRTPGVYVRVATFLDWIQYYINIKDPEKVEHLLKDKMNARDWSVTSQTSKNAISVISTVIILLLLWLLSPYIFKLFKRK